MKDIFEIGSWIECEDGIGQILYNRPVNVELYNDYKGKKGDLLSKVKVKVRVSVPQ